MASSLVFLTVSCLCLWLTTGQMAPPFPWCCVSELGVSPAKYGLLLPASHRCLRIHLLPASRQQVVCLMPPSLSRPVGGICAVPLLPAARRRHMDPGFRGRYPGPNPAAGLGTLECEPSLPLCQDEGFIGGWPCKPPVRSPNGPR